MLSKKINLLLIFLIVSKAIYSYEVTLDFEIDEVKGIDVAMIPFNGTSNVEADVVKLFYDQVISKLIKSGEYRPVSINNWLETTYGNNVFSSTDRLLNSIPAGRIPVTQLCWGNINKIENEYLITFYWYNITTKSKNMYQRRFSFNYIEGYNKTIEETEQFWIFTRKVQKDIYVKNKISFSEYKKNVLNGVIDSIFYELNTRNSKNNYLFRKKILIKKSNVEYFLYSKLDTGEEEFTTVPFLQYKDTSLKDGEDFFSDIFEYSFYKTGIVIDYSDKLGNYLKRSTPLLNDFNYVVESKLKVSNNFSVISIIVRNPQWPLDDNIVIQFDYPIQELSIPSLMLQADKISQLVILNILKEEELKKVGIIDFSSAENWMYTNDDQKIINSEVYVNNVFYDSIDNLERQLLPFGEQNISLDQKDYKVFISPYWLNENYFTKTQSILLEKE